jgi:Ser/Thr protein kinase RdoA (MazF antagonist)
MTITIPDWPGHGALSLRRRIARYVWLCDLEGVSVILKLAAGPVRVAALAHEAAMLRKLAPTGVAPRLIAYAELGGRARLVMTHLRGQHPFAALDPDGGPIRALHRAVRLAHDAGVVHCDLKPSNVLLRHGRAWVIDWGMAAHHGARVAALARRPYSSGWTHPDLIWGRGLVRPAHDLHALARFCGPQGAVPPSPVALQARDQVREAGQHVH